MTQGQFTYAVDLVLCIDATGSMSPVIESVKAAAIKFDDDLRRVMEAKGRGIDVLRVKLVIFRDYWADGSRSMTETEFFTLPSQREQFAEFIQGVKAQGGGSEPENGLEALALAIRSDWTTGGDKRRHVIVVWTDASAHTLEKAAEANLPNYPSDLPKTFSELTEWWEGQDHINQNAKRLLIYAPDAYPWSDIYSYWRQAIHVVSQAGKGLADHDYDEILDSIANSI